MEAYINPLLVWKFVLPLAFILFFWFVFEWRSRRLFSSVAGFEKGNAVHRIVSRAFKVTHYTLLVFLMAFMIEPNFTMRLLGEFFIAKKTVFAFVGIGVWMLSVVITLVAQRQMKSSWMIGLDEVNVSELITTGLFKYSRNPVFLGLVLSFVGVFLALPNFLTFILMIVEFLLIQIQTRMEEVFF